MEVNRVITSSTWSNLSNSWSQPRWEFQESERKTIWKPRSDTDRWGALLLPPIWSVKYVNSLGIIIAHELLPPCLSLRSKRKRFSSSRGASTSSPSNCERLASVYQSVSEGVALIFHRFQFAVASVIASSPVAASFAQIVWIGSAFIWLFYTDRSIINMFGEQSNIPYRKSKTIFPH